MSAHDAFISYSYEADGELAAAIQRGLERLARPWHRVRALRVFRDRTGLSVNPELWTSIAAALDASEWLILLCSPASAASRWVNREVEHWLRNRGADHILLVLTDGELTWDPATRNFDAPHSSALPAALFGRFAAEPRYLDLRWARGQQDLDLRNLEFRAAIAELAAPVHHLDRAELHQEDLRLARRARRLARGGATTLALLLVLSTAFAAFAVQQRERAQHSAKEEAHQAKIAQDQTHTARVERDHARHELNVSIATNLVVQSNDALLSGQTDLGQLLAVEAERLDPSPEARVALLNAVVDQPSLALNLHGLENAIGSAFSGDGRLLAAISTSGDLRIWDLRTGQPLPHQPAPLARAGALVGFADNGRTLVVTSSHDSANGPVREANVVDVSTGHVSKSITLPVNGYFAATATRAPALIASDGSGGAELFNTRTGRPIRNLPSAGTFWTLSPDGSIAAAFNSGRAARIQAWSTGSGLALGPGCTYSLDVSNVDIPLEDVGVTVTADNRTVRATQPRSLDRDTADIVTCDLTTGERATVTLSSGQPGRTFAGVSPDSRFVVTRDESGDGSLFVNDSTTADQVGPVLHAPSDRYYMQGYLPVVFSSDGRLMTAPENDGVVRVWNTATLLPPIAIAAANANVDDLGEFGHRGSIDPKVLDKFGKVWDAVVSDDGRFAAIQTASDLIALDVKSGRTRSVSLRRLGCPQLDPSSPDVELRGLGIAERPPAIVVGCASIHPNGEKGDGLIYIDISKPNWDFAPPVETRVFTDGLEFSADGQWLVAQSGAASDEGRIQVFRITGSHLTAGPVLDGINGSPLITPDGRGFIVSHTGKLLRWTFANAHLTDLHLATAGDAIGLSSDGENLATFEYGRQPGVIKLWNLRTKSLLGTLPIRTGPGAPPTVSFGPANHVVVEGQTTHTTWDLDPASWIRAACTAANRELTTEEWTKYLPGIPKQATCTVLPYLPISPGSLAFPPGP